MRSLAAHRKPNPACKGNQKVKKRILKKRLILCKGKALDCFPFVSRRETIRNHGNPKGYNNAFFTKKSMHACASHKIKGEALACKGVALDCFPLGNHGHPLGDHAFKIFDFNKP